VLYLMVTSCMNLMELMGTTGLTYVSELVWMTLAEGVELFSAEMLVVLSVRSEGGGVEFGVVRVVCYCCARSNIATDR